MIALENRAIYIPAVGTNFWGCWKKNLRHRDFDLKWFSPHSLFRYPYALIRAGFGINYDLYWRERCGYLKDCLLMTDSGGYQISKGGHIDPNVSLGWQELNADIGIVLDVPVRKDSNFGDCLKRSAKNFRIFERNRQNYQMKIYNVLQSGRTMTEMKMWHDAVKGFSFDGWCLSASNEKMQVLGYLMLHENDAKDLHGHFHLFGSSGMKTMLTMAMLSKHFDTPITFDSSSYTMGSRGRRFYRPMNLKDPIPFGRDATRINVNPCHCPICSNATLDDLYSQKKGALAPNLLDLHNMYQFIEVNNEINNLVRQDDSEALKTYAQSVGELDTVQNVEVMPNAYERGRLSRLVLK